MHRYLTHITGLFVAILLISGIVSTKIIQFWPFTFDGGTLLFPLSYIFGDILTEVYGYKESRKVIWIGLVSMVLMSAMILLIGRLPAAGDWTFQADYNNILMIAPRIFIGSIVAYFAGEFVNSYILAKMKVRMQGTRLWMRTIWSTLVAQLFDTVIMITIAFRWVFDTDTFVMIILSNYIFKVAVEIIFTPVTYAVVWWLKKREDSDVYDVGTDFNPFLIK